MAGRQLNARQRNFRSYLDKKMDAYHHYGTAVTPPQENFRNFMFDKRNLNFGFITREQTNLEEINAYLLNAALLPVTPQAFDTNPVILAQIPSLFVDNDNRFGLMLEDILSVPEFAIDLEGNLDHSFFGMTCTMQIATWQNTYIVDVFSCYDRIRTDLAPILAGNAHLKILVGCGNDVISLSRDFNVNMSGALDLQYVHQNLMNVVINYLQTGDRQQITMRDVEGILGRSLLSPTGQLMTVQQLQQSNRNLISMSNLTRLYLPTQQIPADFTTMSDWRQRPLPEGMRQYAAFDVVILLKIWTKMKQLINRQERPNEILISSNNNSKTLLRNYFVRPTRLTEQEFLQQETTVPDDQKPLLGLLHRWRKLYAKTFDENEEELLSVHDMRALVANRADFQTPEAVTTFITNRRNPNNPVRNQRRLPCESLGKWCHQVAQLLRDGNEVWQRFLRTRCHVCDGSLGYPHTAIGCARPTSRETTRAYFSNPLHQEERRRNYLAKKARWERNRPGGAPYPY